MTAQNSNSSAYTSQSVYFKSQYVKTSQLTLHIVSAGNPENETIILLHGFPEFWIGWKSVSERLVNAGYHVILPDQRGYNKSDVPKNPYFYRMEFLVEDIREIIHWVGKDKVILAGHDWGAGVAWAVMTEYPDLISHGIIVNVPHNHIFKRHLFENSSQLIKSWYMFFFQLPFFPSFLLSLSDFSMLRNSLIDTSLDNTFTNKDLGAYVTAWNISGLDGMINWYRASFRWKSSIWYDPIDLPILIVWGKKDAFLDPILARKSLKFCTNGKVEYIDEATHWVLHEFPTEVTSHITDFLEANS